VSLSGNDIETRLLATLVECGLSMDIARIRAAEFAPIVAHDKYRLDRDDAIRRDYARLSATEVATKHGCSRRTVFRVLARWCHKNVEGGTDRMRQ
jgi:hypothetical protein